MSRNLARVVLGLALVALVGAAALLLRLRVARGDVFPPYSTLRADPLGARAFHDALARLPQLHVERRLHPLARVEPMPPRTIVLAGIDRSHWARFTVAELNALESAVRAGSRLVLAMRGDILTAEERRMAREKTAEKAAKKKRASSKFKRTAEYGDLRQRWGIAINDRKVGPADAGAIRAADADPALPETIAWRSDLSFDIEGGAPWRAIYQRGSAAVLLERPFGRGTIVMAAGSYFLSNEALQRDRATALLSWLVGPNRHIAFEEGHLGVIVEPGIAALARRYGLGAAFFTLLLLAGLFIWQRVAAFVPAAESEPAGFALSYNPAAGLEALLRRSVPVAELGTACLDEWRHTASPAERRRVDPALSALPGKTPPVLVHNTARRALQRR
ncbi:MAG: DUF4350 domain-containing protein [Opitutaceae bacterium]|nr:DUF4350 domain-containing protein [Opitutaceae bacterium]